MMKKKLFRIILDSEPVRIVLVLQLHCKNDSSYKQDCIKIIGTLSYNNFYLSSLKINQ